MIFAPHCAPVSELMNCEMFNTITPASGSPSNPHRLSKIENKKTALEISIFRE